MVDESAVCAAVASAARRLRRPGGSVAVEVVAAGQRLDAITCGSRVVALLSSAMDSSALARRDAGAVRIIEPLLSLGLVSKFQATGSLTIIAVITHTLLLAVLGVPVHDVGWGIRAALVAAGAAVMRWPEPLVAAWQDRTSSPDARRP